MNARKSTRSTSTIRSTFVVVITALLLLSGHAHAAAQVDPLARASGYFDWLLGHGGSATLASPDSVLHSPEGIFRGQDGAGAFALQLGTSFSDLEIEVQSADVAGNSLVVEFTLSGVHTGSYQGLDWDCARVSAPGVAVLRAGDDGFSDQWISYDQQTLLDQIHVHSLTPTSERASCDAYQRVANPVAMPAAQPEAPAAPPQCLTRSMCEMAF